MGLSTPSFDGAYPNDPRELATFQRAVGVRKAILLARRL
jgi:hypothetical protein